MIIPANSESSISFVDPKEIKQTDGRVEKSKELEERIEKDDHGNMVLNPEWMSNCDYNRMCLNELGAMLTDALRAKEYVYFNELRTAIGLPKTKAGGIVGIYRMRPNVEWINEESDPIRPS